MQSTSTVIQEEIFGPVAAVMKFRTAKEAIALANNTKFGLGASVWTENISLAMEVALSVKAGTCWINSHNLFDAASGFGMLLALAIQMTLDGFSPLYLNTRSC